MQNQKQILSITDLSTVKGCFRFRSQTFRHETFRYRHFGPRDISVQGHFGTGDISVLEISVPETFWYWGYYVVMVTKK